jgi:hypothetical protein
MTDFSDRIPSYILIAAILLIPRQPVRLPVHVVLAYDAMHESATAARAWRTTKLDSKIFNLPQKGCLILNLPYLGRHDMREAVLDSESPMLKLQAHPPKDRFAIGRQISDTFCKTASSHRTAARSRGL